MKGKWKPYSKYRNSEVEWIGALPKHWQIKRIKHTTYVKGRIGWQGLKSDELIDEGPYLVTGTDFETGRVNWNNSYHVSVERYDEDPFIQLKENDLLITKDGTIGKTAIVRDLPGVACLNSGIFVTRPIASDYLNDYMYWLLNSDVFIRFIDFKKTGTTIAHLYQNVFVEFSFPIPILEEQHSIVNFLNKETDKIDQLIAKKERQIELLKEKRTALISHAVTKGLNPNAKMKNSGIEWIGEIPEHWEVAKTKYVADLKTGHTPSRQHPEYWEDCTIPWFSLADVWQLRSGRQEYLGDTNESINEIGLKNSSAELLPPGTVVVSRTASVGFSGIMPIEMATTQDFVNWVCGPRMSPSYLLYVFRSMNQEFKRLIMGSTHQTIYMPDAASFNTPIPPMGEQLKMVKYIHQKKATLDSLEDLVLLSIDRLREYRTALISAAVTGKIDIRKEAA